jgi:hypothetical protein
MSKPFTVITILLLLLIAAAHVARVYYGVAVVVGSHHIPMEVSYGGAAVSAFLAIMVLVELARGK